MNVQGKMRTQEGQNESFQQITDTKLVTFVEFLLNLFKS